MNTVRIAVAQTSPRVGELEHNRKHSRAWIRQLAGAEARLIVLPELASSGYVFDSVEEARGVAEGADGETVSGWVESAARLGDTVIIGGFAELGDDGELYNSAAVVGPAGLVAVYRKTHLWDREKLFFRPGSVAPPVVDTPFGRIGIAICYDLYFPELTRGLALAGADLIVVPANLPLFPRPDGERPVEIALAQATAHVNKVWVALCDRTGSERGVDWTGASCIVDPDGFLAAGPVPGYGAGWFFADCDLERSRDKAWGERNDVRGDLRPDLYASPRPASEPSRIASSSERGERRSPASTAP